MGESTIKSKKYIKVIISEKFPLKYANKKESDKNIELLFSY